VAGDRIRREAGAMQYVLAIDGWLPERINVLLRRHWAKRNRILKADAVQLKIEADNQNIPMATGKRRVTLTLFHNRMASDPDARLKGLLDALVKCGLLIDDSLTWLELGPVRSVMRAVKGIEIVLEDIRPWSAPGAKFPRIQCER
jgi:Holliday junction resolvase RusA-like endonuclease